MQFTLSSLVICVANACAVVLLACQGAGAAASYAVKPPPTWVKTVVPSVELSPGDIPNGVSSTKVLDDQQVRVNGNSLARFYHYYQRVNNAAGLEDLSQLRFEFEPSYQQLTIHFVRILRGASVINALNVSEIKTIHEEEDLDQQLFNGTEAAVIFVNDVRVGDTVEYAYTITGDNPVLGGRFTDTFYVGGDEPILEFLFRLVYPTKRQLFIKNDNTEIQPSKQVIGEDTEYLWYSKNVATVTYEDSTPAWLNPYPRVNLSEFQNWSDVVNWALPFYQNSAIKSTGLRTKVDEWLKSSSTPEERTTAALQFVQDEIRYLGIELGRYSHQPTEPEKVFARRFGDCKDKSLLLSSILNAMGIEAAPALVNTEEKATLDSWQPTPFAFNHVIVQTKINGKTYWLDPTISYQRAGLAGYYDPGYMRGLVLRPGTEGLTTIPLPGSNAGSLEILEVYTAGNSNSSVLLTVTKTYRGIEADEIRYWLSSTSPAHLSTNRLNYYADSTPAITASGLPVVEDDQKTNTLVVREKYLISELWKDDRHTFVADRIYAALDKPRVSQRSLPLEVRYPLSITQTIIIDLGRGYSFPEDSDVLTDDALRFEYSYSNQGNRLTMSFSLKTFADSVPASALQRHLAILDKAQDRIGFTLTKSRGGIGPSKAPPSNVLLALTWLVILVPVIGLVIWLVRRRGRPGRRNKFTHDLQPQPGMSPETAIGLSGEEQIESFLKSFSCRCGARPYSPDSPAKRERFSYDGQRLIGIRLQCSACRQNSDLYLNPLFENEGSGIADLSTS